MGPSGAGKTLFLEAIAGFRKILKGKIFVEGRDVSKLPPEKRGLAYVPQDYALWPHMTVYENIAYGIKARKVGKNEVKKRVLEVAEIMGIRELLNRMPKTLSGGEMQRVAVARALITEPKAVLLDEPLSSLDTATKNKVKDFMKELHSKLKFTAIHVTHDPLEATELGDRIAVMIGGEIIQVGKPIEVLRNPKTIEAAWVGGIPNLIEGIVKQSDGEVVNVSVGDIEIVIAHKKPLMQGLKALLMLRPEDIVLSKSLIKTSARNTIKCKVVEVEDKGPLIHVKIERGKLNLRAVITRGSYEELEIKPGKEIYASFKASAVRVISTKSLK